ncbi:TPA: DUF3131 domain-containing protein [Candidatus Bathyarchaeota archaeon]|nr:DUF3131 domain-containing protein [Candidatus Bathyarchaeota archaeon]
MIAMQFGLSISPVASSPSDYEENWMKWARIAWNYYKPGNGVVESTGLHDAGKGFHQFTDWDLATYILAIIDAESLGILPREGEWGADYRIRKILDFLKSRPLTPEGIPYLWYSSITGKNATPQHANPSDSGRLLISLYLLKKHRPDLSTEIDYIVNRNNYRLIASDTEAWKTTGAFYAYYVALGFKLFGFGDYGPVKSALDWINTLEKAPKIDVDGVLLPKTGITSEPILLGALELGDPNLLYYANLTCQAHEAHYQRTGTYVAFSEGNTGLKDPSYVYEWIVSGDKTWLIRDPRGKVATISPIIFLKAAIAYHALFSTDYTRELVNYLMSEFESKGWDFSQGFPEGIDANGRLVSLVIDKTNGLVLSAAKHALSKKIRPRFEFSNIKVSETEVTLGGSVSVSGYVQNIGNKTANDVILSISIGDLQVSSTNLGSIAPKEHKLFVLRFQVPMTFEPGQAVLRIEVNCSEGSTGFLEMSITIKSLAPKLTFQAIHIPSMALKGAAITVEGNVTNEGEQDALNAKLLLYLNETLLKTEELGDIAVGESKRTSIEAIIPIEVEEGDCVLRVVLKSGEDEWTYEYIIAIGELQEELISKTMERVSSMLNESMDLLEKVEKVVEIKRAREVLSQVKETYLEAVHYLEAGNYNESAKLLDETIVGLENLNLLIRDELYGYLKERTAELMEKSTIGNITSMIIEMRGLIDELKEQDPVTAINSYIRIASLLDSVSNLMDEIKQEEEEKEDLTSELNQTKKELLAQKRRGKIWVLTASIFAFSAGAILAKMKHQGRRRTFPRFE